MIRSFKVSNFRCLQSAELEFDPGFNLVVGANASGKTSLLEALAYLGRGKSFRGAARPSLYCLGVSTGPASSTAWVYEIAGLVSRSG